MTLLQAEHDAALETNNKPGDAGTEWAVTFASLAKLEAGLLEVDPR